VARAWFPWTTLSGPGNAPETVDPHRTLVSVVTPGPPTDGRMCNPARPGSEALAEQVSDTNARAVEVETVEIRKLTTIEAQQHSTPDGNPAGD
jgi:hypothetical protein